MRIASKATKGKGKRWKRGESSSSNPETRKYRSSVQQFSSRTNVDLSGLTQELLRKHEACQSLKNLNLDSDSIIDRNTIEHNDLDNENIEENESFAGSEMSYASLYSNCTNASFSKFLNNWNSSSALHRGMLAVLATVTELIKEKGGKETETEYFAALITTIETVKDDESLTSAVLLLSIVLKRVPPQVLRLKFSDSCKLLLELLTNYVESNHGALIRGLINCLSTLLRNQEKAVWQLSSTKRVYDFLLSLVINPKPRVRHAAQRAVIGILSGSVFMQNSQFHPMILNTADFCVLKIEESKVLDENNNIPLYILGLLKHVIAKFPNDKVQKCCETMLRLMLLRNVVTVSCVFEVFHSLFFSNPSVDILNPKLNIQIILAFYDFQPSSNDTQPLCAWLSVMRAAFANLYQNDKQLFFNNLSKAVSVIVSLWLSDSKEVHQHVTDSLNSLLLNSVEPSLDEIGINNLQHFQRQIEIALGFQYFNAWDSVLNVISTFFKVIGSLYPELVQPLLKTLAELRESHNFAFTPQLDNAFRQAIMTLGPEAVLSACPLELNEERNDFSRSWMIPMLRDNIDSCELRYFIKRFVPLAFEYQERIRECQQKSLNVESKVYSVLLSQIWSLFPAFCRNPKDLVSSFNETIVYRATKERFPKILGLILTTAPELRQFVLSGLRTLIRKHIDGEEKRELSKFAQNYLPILFNLYTLEKKQCDKDSKLQVLETIQIYLLVTNKDVIRQMYQKITERLQASPDAEMELALLDLVITFIPHLNEKYYLEFLFSYSSETVKDKNNRKQKKGYRLIEEICKNRSKSFNDFVDEKLSNIMELVICGLNKAATSAKAPPLRTIRILIEEKLKDKCETLEKMANLIFEDILFCLTFPSEKITNAVTRLIIVLANVFKSFGEEKFESMVKMFHPLNDNTDVPRIHATKLLFSYFYDDISKLLKYEMAQKCLCNLTNKNRNHIQASIDFSKILIKRSSPDALMSLVEFIINNLTSLNYENNKHFRFKIKEILTKLVRKVG